MSKSNIDFSLLWKKLFGKLDNSEQKRLDQWIKADQKNQKLLDKLEAFQQSPDKISHERHEQAWQEVKAAIQASSSKTAAREKPNSFRFFYRAAAVFVLAAATILLWEYADTSNGLSSAETVGPGSAKATLITSSGQSILLGDTVVALSSRGIQAEASGTGLTYFSNVDSASITEEINMLVVPRGGEFQLTLTDGTRIWLNSETTIRYPVRFVGPIRKVELTGEAYFDVAKNAAQPFEVITEGQTITVLGTSFDVAAYPDESQTLTTLVEGKIAVNLLTGASIQVTPGYQSLFEKESGALSSRMVDTALYTSWKDGLFIFEDQRLDAILSKLARWYDVSVVFDNKDQKEVRFTAHIDKYQSLAEVLKLIEITDAVDFEVENKILIVN